MFRWQYRKFNFGILETTLSLLGQVTSDTDRPFGITYTLNLAHEGVVD